MAAVSSLRLDSTLQSSRTQSRASYPGRRLCARLLVVEHSEQVKGAVGQTCCARDDWLLLAQYKQHLETRLLRDTELLLCA